MLLIFHEPLVKTEGNFHLFGGVNGQGTSVSKTLESGYA